MWRQWQKWEELKNNARNYWIHTHILRKPGMCTGKFRYQRETDDGRYAHYTCKDCGYPMAVSRNETFYGPIPFPSIHQRELPDYCNEPKICQQLLRLMAERGENDSLIKQVLAALKTPTDPIERAGFLSHLSLTPELVANAFVKGYGARLTEDWKGYEERQQWPLQRALGHLDETGVPLFARIGGYQETYHEWDMPYLLYPPSHFPHPTAEILVAERPYSDWHAPKAEDLFTSFQKTL